MSTFLRPLTHVLGRPLAVFLQPALRLSARPVGLALVYHRVGDPPGDPDRELVPARGTAQFESELKHLKKRYRVVPASRLLEAAARRRRGERVPVSITFDDDLRSHLEVAMPILERHGLPATFFLCGASLQTPFVFWWESLQVLFDSGRAREAMKAIADSEEDPEPASIHEAGRRIERMSPERRATVAARLRALAGPDSGGLSAEQVRTLASRGFAIGFHTRRHDMLPALDDEQLGAAMTEGRDEVAAAAGGELTSISYPHGRGDARVAAAARAAGYTFGFTAASEPAGPATDPHLIPRIGPTVRSPSRAALQMTLTLLSLPDIFRPVGMRQRRARD